LKGMEILYAMSFRNSRYDLINSNTH
jgi:hypothetical protein